ncbi:hypothetical protein YQE_06446, partial [Dendroctonus ponderosae]
MQATRACKTSGRNSIIEDQIRNILPRVPAGLQECVLRLMNKDIRQRPTAQLLMLLKFFE